MDVNDSVKSLLFYLLGNMKLRKECQLISIVSKTIIGIPKSIIPFEKPNLAIFWMLFCLYDRKILSITQKNLITIEAHLQTPNFQNKLEAQWASIL
jgi:hypothetical protein